MGPLEARPCTRVVSSCTAGRPRGAPPCAAVHCRAPCTYPTEMHRTVKLETDAAWRQNSAARRPAAGLPCFVDTVQDGLLFSAHQLRGVPWRAGVMKWQTCQTQNLVRRKLRVGSSPTAGRSSLYNSEELIDVLDGRPNRRYLLTHRFCEAADSFLRLPGAGADLVHRRPRCRRSRRPS